MVRRESAKLLFVGSIPTRTFFLKTKPPQGGFCFIRLSMEATPTAWCCVGNRKAEQCTSFAAKQRQVPRARPAGIWRQQNDRKAIPTRNFFYSRINPRVFYSY